MNEYIVSFRDYPDLKVIAIRYSIGVDYAAYTFYNNEGEDVANVPFINVMHITMVEKSKPLGKVFINRCPIRIEVREVCKSSLPM